MRIPTLSPNMPAEGPMAQPPFVTIPEDSTQNNTLFNEDAEDNVGSLYYVVAVIFIYGFSIVLMIASHIRKNQQDNQLRTYLKEMALLRKKDRREKILGRMTTLNATNAVCSNLHNAVSVAGTLTTSVGSGQALVSSGSGSISRCQQPLVSSGCTFAHVNIGSCPCGIHVAAVNVGQNHSHANVQSVSHSNYAKNNQPSFLHDCLVNCSNSPLLSTAQPSAISRSSMLQCGSNCNMLPVASITNTRTTTDTSTTSTTATIPINNNNNNNCSMPSSSSSSSNSSAVSTIAITVIASTPVTSSTISDPISTIAVASTSTCDSAISTGSRMSVEEGLYHHQQQSSINYHQKVDEAQEIMLLQAQLTQIQLHQKQQNNRGLDPVLSLESHCVDKTANRGKLPNETNIEILSEKVIT